MLRTGLTRGTTALRLASTSANQLPSLGSTSSSSATSSGSSSSSSSSSSCFSTSAISQAKSAPGRGKDARQRARVVARSGGAKALAAAAKQEPTFVSLDEAARVFQAIEVSRPLSAYELHIVTSVSSHQANALRGRVSLPKESRTKSEKLLIFAEEGSEGRKAADEALKSSGAASGSITVGGAELISDVQSGRGAGGGDFTKVLCTPGMLPSVTKALARSLGPRGLMPSAKRGTVAASTSDMARAILEARGAMDWRGDRNGVVRGAIGRINFTTDELRGNISTLLAAIVDKVASGLGGSSAETAQPITADEATRKSPQAVKRAGAVIKQIHLSSTQGPAVLLDLKDCL